MGRKKSIGANFENEARKAAMLLKQASDPTRLVILAMLAENQEMHVGALRDQLNQSLPAISHHLALLRHGGLIQPRRVGQNNFYSLTERGEALADAVREMVS